MAENDMRAKIIEATMALASEKPILSLGFGEIAERAGIGLGDVRMRYPTRIAIIEDFVALIDEAVLAGGEADGTGFGEPARDRLFDILMRRFDALLPYRAGLKGLRKAAMRDPLLAATLNRIVVGSHMWTLAAADLEPTGPFAPMRRLARAQALAMVTGRLLPVFLDETAPDLPKTMAALDKALDRLDRAAKTVTRLEQAVDSLIEKATSRRGRKGGPHAADAEADATPDAEAGSDVAAAGERVRQPGVFTRDEMTSGASRDEAAADNGAATAIVTDTPEVSPPTGGTARRPRKQPKSSTP